MGTSSAARASGRARTSSAWGLPKGSPPLFTRGGSDTLPGMLVLPTAYVRTRPRRQLFRRFLTGLGLMVLLGTACLAYARFIEPNWVAVTRHRVQVAGLKREVKLAHLTDLHLREWGRLERTLLHLLEQEKPDLIVITGDTASPGTPDSVRYELLSRLRAPEGVHAIRGNWEHWSPMEDEAGLYRRAGIRLLDNSAQQVAGQLWLVGLDDGLAGNPDIAAALAAVPSRAPCVILLHSPAFLDEVAGRCPLALAGHTHGGQVRLPGLGPLWLPPGSGDYEAGWYEHTGTKMYVSRGIGTSVVHLRFRCRPELAIITLSP